jgi:hypothetical protein
MREISFPVFNGIFTAKAEMLLILLSSTSHEKLTHKSRGGERGRKAGEIMKKDLKFLLLVDPEKFRLMT